MPFMNKTPNMHRKKFGSWLSQESGFFTLYISIYSLMLLGECIHEQTVYFSSSLYYKLRSFIRSYC